MGGIAGMIDAKTVKYMAEDQRMATEIAKIDLMKKEVATKEWPEWKKKMTSQELDLRKQRLVYKRARNSEVHQGFTLQEGP